MDSALPPHRKGLAHSLNNPLAALLAELQLLQLDELTDAQRESADRCVELCRRLIAIVKERIPPTME